MMRFLIITTLVLLASIASAQNLESKVLEDQFGESVALNEQTEWLIFTSSMDGGRLVRDAFEAEGMNGTILKKKHIVYVADIHRMPGLISKAIAIPAMRKYDFPIGLDKTGDPTADWARKEDAVTIYKLEKLKVMDIQFYQDAGAVQKAINSMK